MQTVHVVITTVGLVLLLSRPATLNAQTLTILHQFGATASDGVEPQASLTLVGSTLYGTTVHGGTNNPGGTVFAINTDGSGYTILHQFGAIGDHFYPQASFALVGSTLYGTALGDTIADGSIVFAINTDGSGYTILHQFDYYSGDGDGPYASLTLVGSTLYGTTFGGGTRDGGTVFAINAGGSGYTILHQFVGYPSDGNYPEASLTLVGSTLYGTTYRGGTNDDGTVFAINTGGSGYTILHQFKLDAGGAHPTASLTLVGSTLYGTTSASGSSSGGTVFAINTDGSGYTILHQFGAAGDGYYPEASLTPVGSTLYGTTSAGVGSFYGTVFAINTDSSGYTILHQFVGYPTDGQSPYASLTLVGSTLYGTTVQGGTNYLGTVFALGLPAPPSIGITTSGNQIVISWPTNATSYALQSIANLSSGSWSNVTSGITIVGTNYLFTRTMNGNAAFFRLNQ